MNTSGRTPKHFIVTLLAMAMILLSACQPGAATTNPQPAQPTAAVPPAETMVATAAATQPAAQPSATQAPATQPTETNPPAATTPSAPADATAAPANLPAVTMDTGGVAQGVTEETVEAVPASAGGPPWEAAPRYTRLTLTGYPVTNHLMKPQIFIYPVAELATFNESAGKIAADLQSLLQSQQAGDRLPFLPLFNAAQVMHAQVQFVDFKSGKGVRFLTQFDQAPLPINNYELIYSFQGLTSDGKYYVAAVLPINHPDLPADNQVSPQQAQDMNDFPAYLAKTVAMLNQQPGSSFTPDVAKLDALIQSIEVK